MKSVSHVSVELVKSVSHVSVELVKSISHVIVQVIEVCTVNLKVLVRYPLLQFDKARKLEQAHNRL